MRHCIFLNLLLVCCWLVCMRLDGATVSSGAAIEEDRGNIRVRGIITMLSEKHSIEDRQGYGLLEVIVSEPIVYDGGVIWILVDPTHFPLFEHRAGTFVSFDIARRHLLETSLLDYPTLDQLENFALNDATYEPLFPDSKVAFRARLKHVVTRISGKTQNAFTMVVLSPPCLEGIVMRIESRLEKLKVSAGDEVEMDDVMSFFAPVNLHNGGVVQGVQVEDLRLLRIVGPDRNAATNRNEATDSSGGSRQFEE